MFLIYVILWLRAHNIKGRTMIRIDQGSEFPGISKKKLEETNEIFIKYLDCFIQTIPKGQSQKNAIVENSHRKDDEEFLIPFFEVIKDKRDFLDKAQKWLLYWNTKRIHHAKGFNSKGERAIEHLKRTVDNLTNTDLVYFPVFLMEDIFDHITPSLSDFLPEKLLRPPLTSHFSTLNHLYSYIISNFSNLKWLNISVPSTNFW